MSLKRSCSLIITSVPYGQDELYKFILQKIWFRRNINKLEQNLFNLRLVKALKQIASEGQQIPIKHDFQELIK